MEIGEGIEGLDEEEVYQRVETKKKLYISRERLQLILPIHQQQFLTLSSPYVEHSN